MNHHYSPSYSITMRLSYPDEPGRLGQITSVLGEVDGQIGAIDIVSVEEDLITRDITVSATNVEHGERIVERIRSVDGINVVYVSDRTFLLHLGGKIEIKSKVPVKTRDDLSMAYTPGVARVCRAIYEDPEAAFNLTVRGNMVAVVSDGSAVLGLGNIGPKAAMPVMEGKALLFKEFADVDAFPICLDTQDVEALIDTVRYLAPTFGGINLEDISAPRCIEIEERLSQELDIPVFHDDQHGTAIVVLAALRNALRLVNKEIEAIRIVINGAGAAGSAIARLLHAVGARHIIACDRAGALYAGRPENMNAAKKRLAEVTNPEQKAGSLQDVLQGADVFVGVSTANVLTREDVKNMNADPIVFALANPDPEITPEEAGEHVRIIATGRSDYPNQINNVLCFPGFFRGMLDVRASKVTSEMKLAASQAIADVIPQDALHPDYIIPSVFDRRVAAAVADAVAGAAIEAGVARRQQKRSAQTAS